MRIIILVEEKGYGEVGVRRRENEEYLDNCEEEFVDFEHQHIARGLTQSHTMKLQ